MPQPEPAGVSFAADRTQQHSRGFAVPEVGVIAQEVVQNGGLQHMGGLDGLKGVFHPKCFWDSISTPELGFIKKEVQHYKGETHPLLPAHHHTAPLLFSQTPTGQELAPHKHQTLLTHTHLPLLSAPDPADLQQGKTIRRVQNEGLLTPVHTHKPLGTANLGRFKQPPLCRGFAGSSRAARAQAESETLLLQPSCACPSSCL